MGALKDYYPDNERTFHWQRRSDAVKFLSEKITFKRVKETYHRLLLDKKKRVAVFRTYPEKYFDQVQNQEVE